MILPFFERTNLNPREQQLLSILTLVVGAALLFALPVGLSLKVSSRAAENEDLRTALTSLQGARGRVKERQMQRDSISARYKHPPAIANIVETASKAAKVDINDNTPRPDVPIGKRYSEHSSTMHMKKVGLSPIVKFMENIERSTFPASVSRLNVRKRGGETDSYDVELGVTTYDRVEDKAADKAAEKDKKDADKKEAEKK